jgi:ATP-dependent Clp protease ATP-binding subunit ClpB
MLTQSGLFSGHGIEIGGDKRKTPEFTPEFLNRIDEIVVFHGLSRQAIGSIVDLQLAKAVERLAERKITLTVDASALEFIANEGYDPTYGARPLRRAIQRFLLDPLALQLLDGKFTEGDTVTVSVDKGGKALLPPVKPVKITPRWLNATACI